MEEKKNNKGIVWFIIILIVLILGIIGCIIYKSTTKKLINSDKDNQTNEKMELEEDVITSKYDSEKFYFENLSNIGYGFAKVYFNNRYEIIQLNKTGENKTIMSFAIEKDNSIWNEPFHMQISNDKFIFEITYATDFKEGEGWKNSNTRLYSIDLKTLKINEIINSNDFDLTYDEYAVNEKYIFIPRTQDTFLPMEYKITRYSLDSLEATIINEDLQADELFIFNNKLFMKCFNDDYKNLDIKNNEKINDDNTNNYFSMDFDGNNITAYTEEEYIGFRNSAKVDYEHFNTESYLIFNNKKIYIEDNKLYYDNEIIYTPNNNKTIELQYTDKLGYVAICEYEVIEQISIGNKTYHLINLETEEVQEVSDNEVYDFYQVLY